MAMPRFHPAVGRWFERTFDAPTEAQAQGWPAIRAGRHVLIAAPTGSGKTLAAFLAAIDQLICESLAGTLEEGTRVLYVSPLKALGNDVRKNLRLPLEGIAAELGGDRAAVERIRAQVRSGDSTPSERQAMLKRPPHILVTTPESLYLLLTSEGGRESLRTVRTVIVDEIHAVANDKRGAHLSLSLERLQALVQRPLQRIGLSATQRPIAEVARFLVGAANVDADGNADCVIVDSGRRRSFDLGIEMPRSPLEALMSGEVWEEVYDRLAALIQEHRTTLLFVNTRRVAERVARHLESRLGNEAVAAHHGSLSKEARLRAESALKAGQLRALVATASLELGIDIGAIDLVVQIGSPRAIATLLQRVGRASHHVGGVPKGRLVPLSRDDLVECIAALDAVRRGELDTLVIREAPIDILAQQIVAAVAAEEWREDDLYDCVRRAWPYRGLSRQSFDEVVEMLAEGFTTRRGQRGRYLHLDAVHGRLRGRRGARLTALTCGGAIPDNFEFRVVQVPEELPVGSVDEEFAVESAAGDIFQLGTHSWRILGVSDGLVRVEDAHGAPPTIPFWFGEAPGRTRELSEAVSRLREEVAARLGEDGRDVGAATAWLRDEVGIDEVAARAAADYLAAGMVSLGAMPTRDTLVLERFFDQAGDMHVVIHAPFGIRMNRAWGLALRKVFCRTFNFELQAAANDDALVLSLGPTHSFPVQDVFAFLQPGRVRDKLVQALLDAPMFPVRWRWNASRSLALKRFISGKRVAPQLQRMDSEDLLAVVFPDQLACLENIQGDREIPDHPLVAQTIEDCLHEAMDFAELEELLGAMSAGDKRLIARDLREASPMAQAILAAPPYAFLDDGEAGERRTLAVRSRRWPDAESAEDLGALDLEAIERVRQEAWPQVADADELHDALMLHGFLTETEGEGWRHHMDALLGTSRATALRHASLARPLWVAAERIGAIRAALARLGVADVEIEPETAVPARVAGRELSPDAALVELVRGRLQALGPVTESRLAGDLGVEPSRMQSPLLALEAEGFAFRGHFTPGLGQLEWCERRLLARVHRYTLHRLRAEIEPLSTADFTRFLLQWQRVAPSARAQGAESLATLLEQLEGYEAPAVAWEAELLPARLQEYDPVWLDALCLAGRITWTRLSPPASGPRSGGRGGPVRATPITLLARSQLPAWRSLARDRKAGAADLSPSAARVLEALEGRGASFFADLASQCHLLETQLEDALGELVFQGLVTSDGYTGLRALLVPSSRRRPRPGGKRKGSVAVFGMENAGRWSALDRDVDHDAGAAIEHAARGLLRRYGVVFRRLLARESMAPPWRDLVRVYHRLEARGEIRGGRFVAGFGGEQFALPEAVGKLRAIRRQEPAGELIALSAADPLNLVGILTTGERLPALADNRLLYRDGVLVATRSAGKTTVLAAADAAQAWDLERALQRRLQPARLRAYLG